LAYKHILGFEDDIFKITPLAIDINDTRGLHVGQLVRDALRNMGQPMQLQIFWCLEQLTGRMWEIPVTAALRL